MVTLGFAHLVYVVLVVLIISIMALKKDVIIPCLAGLFIMGLVYTKDVVKAFQAVFNSMIVSGSELWSIILIISLIVAMSSAFREFRVDSLMLAPIKGFMVNRNASFFILGAIMMVVSLVIWPSPAVALVGAIIMPAAVKAGLSPLWAAVSMNLFGHGIALSGDYFIQGAPAISAKAAGLEPSEIISASIPLWITMSVVTIGTAFFMMLRESKKNPVQQLESIRDAADVKPTGKAKITVFLTLTVFALDIVAMMVFELRGGDATALVGGSVMLLMTVSAVLQHGFKEALDKTADHIREGFKFGIKIFAPIIVIGAFFFMGAEEAAKQVYGEGAYGIFSDLGMALSQSVPLAKAPIVAVQAFVGFIVGFDGSGFSGLPLTGALSATFANSGIAVDQSGLAALGQLMTVWVGGGTIIPWAVIPVAAICNVNPVDLARKNMIPVMAGFAATIIVAMFIL